MSAARSRCASSPGSMSSAMAVSPGRRSTAKEAPRWHEGRPGSADGEVFDRGGVGTVVAMFGDSRRFLFREWSDGNLDHVDLHRTIVDFGELIVAVQGGPVAESAPGGPPGGGGGDGDRAVEWAGGRTPVFVVGAADAGFEDDPAGPFTPIGIRPPVEHLLSHHLERPLGAVLYPQVVGQPDGTDRLDRIGHLGGSFLDGSFEGQQFGGAGVRHGLNPPLVPLAQWNRVEVVDAIASTALGEDEASFDKYREMLHDREPAQLREPGGKFTSRRRRSPELVE